MLGLSLLNPDASKIELLHARSGTTFTFPLSDRNLTDEYLVATDLSGDSIKLDDHAAVEKVAAGSGSSPSDRRITGRSLFVASGK
jgi:hypothetical protein